MSEETDLLLDSVWSDAEEASSSSSSGDKAVLRSAMKSSGAFYGVLGGRAFALTLLRRSL